MPDAWIIDAVRTPRGRGKAGRGALSGVHPQELLAQALRGLERAPGFVPSAVDDVIAGCVTQVRDQGSNIARQAVLAAGWPVHVPGTTVHRYCASGLQALHFAATAVQSGANDLVVAGGVESMSRVPMGSEGAGQDGGNDRLRERLLQVPQGISADLIASHEGFTRDELDAWALRSQQRATHAAETGRFARSLIPVVDGGRVLLARDEAVRPDTTHEGLAALPPSFAQVGAAPCGDRGTYDAAALAAHPVRGGLRHLHTAGNSSGLADGAAAIALASDAQLARAGLRPRARIRAMAVVGSDPVLMLTGPAPASRKALARAGMSAADIDLWEVNEAFASVVLQTIRALELDPERVNVNGGAIALGHPLGATGAMLVGTALDELERRGAATALVTMCIGGGQGIATILERVA